MFFKKNFARKAPGSTRSVKMAVPVPSSIVLADDCAAENTELFDCALTASFGVCSLEGRKKEDRIVCGERVFRDIVLYAVIDGHGGSEAADYLKEALPRVVSMLCKERFIQKQHEVQPHVPISSTMVEDFPEVFEHLMQTAYKICSDEWDGGVLTTSRKMAGAVATTVLVQNRTCIIAHVGDCRVVAATATASAELTEEHRASMPAEKERIERKGGRVVDGRVRGLLSPSRAFGDLHVRTGENGQVLDCITPDPDVSVFQVDLQGFLILSTDGVNDVVTGIDSAHIVRESLRLYRDSALAAKELASCAAKRNNDDISVIVLNWL